MRANVLLGLLAGVVALAAIGCQGDEGTGPGTTKETLTIAVVPKGTMHVFWKSVHAGAKQAEKELNADVAEGAPPKVKILWQGPVVEDDRAAQVNLVETFIQKRVDGIVLAPLDSKALVTPVRSAKTAGVPVVIIDSDLADPEAYVSFVATDNYKGGVLGARRLAELLPDGGKVILLRYQVGSASTENREKGFLDEIAKFPKIQVISSDQYAGATVESAMNQAQAILTKYGEGQVDGIFCPNESSAYGMLRALVESGRAGKIHYVGFDASDRLVEALEKGHIAGLVVQNPVRMGHDGVVTMVKHLRGEPVEKRIDTGVTLVTPENLPEPEIQILVHPSLE
ncbi:MAG: substrate-binding domain-containing protein [Planctomycetes bacterium]|nr:substrate-binding domain-containing protein [Planctomycetota bacterium]